MAQTFHCPSCGAPLDPPSGSELSMRCPFCSSSVIIPEELRRKTHHPDTLSRAQALADIPQSGQDMMEIIRLVKAGQKEEAILRFRQAFDTSRVEAVATIDAIERNQVVQLTHSGTFRVDLPRPDPAVQRPSSVSKKRIPWVARPGCLAIFILAVTGGIIAFVGLLIMLQPGGLLREWWLKSNPSSNLPLILSFGEEGELPGQLTDPRNLAVDGAGNIFVADFTTGRILQFDPQGSFVRMWDAGDGKMVIRTLEVDQDGILYAAIDRAIWRFDTRSGEQLDPLPNPNNYFYEEFKILSGGGFGAVVDREDLVRLNPDGSLVWIVEEAISSIAEESDSGNRLAIDGNNNFYLVGSFVESIFVYSPEGRYINRWGSEGDEPGQFQWIHALTIDGQGRVVVGDGSALEIFESDGRFVEQIDLDDIPYDIQIDAQGKLYMVTLRPARVNVYQFK